MSAPNSLESLSRIAPITDEEAARMFGTTGREHLLDAITRVSPSRERPARYRVRRPLVLVVAAVLAAAATAAVAWAVTRGAARETTSIECVIAGTDTVIDATSGIPANDCAAEWQRELGTPAPPLVAYDNRHGGVTVLPRSQTPPAGWQPLQSQDVEMIELQESLDDYVNGLNSSCLGGSAAATFAQKQLDRLGLVGWTVTVRPSSQSVPAPAAPTPTSRSGTPAAPTENTHGSQLCTAGSIVDPTTATVTLIPTQVTETPPGWLPQRLASSLRTLSKTCLPLPSMRAAVEQQATQLGLTEQASGSPAATTTYQLDATHDNILRCTRLYETVGGTINLVLRGPTH
jgi:hypothetical protein